jgi:hypothetical protein
MVEGIQGLRPVLVPMLIIGMGLLGGCASAGGTMRAGDVADAGSTPKPAAGSSVGVSVGDETGDVADAGPSAQATATPAPASRNSAAVALQAQAERESAAGNYAQAASTLERAVRIDPADGALWLALARLRLDQGQRELAVELARRAESLAAPGSALRSQARDVEQQAATGAPR